MRGEIMFSVHKTIADRDHFWSEKQGAYIITEYALKIEMYNYNKAVQLRYMLHGEIKFNDGDKTTETPKSRNIFKRDPQIEEPKQSGNRPTRIRKI